MSYVTLRPPVLQLFSTQSAIPFQAAERADKNGNFLVWVEEKDAERIRALDADPNQAIRILCRRPA